jgi:hypothetical protein
MRRPGAVSWQCGRWPPKSTECRGRRGRWSWPARSENPARRRRQSTVTTPARPLRLNSSLTIYTRVTLNSKVKTWLCGTTTRTKDVVSAPLPVPDSTTREPARSTAANMTALASNVKTVCVLWRSAQIQSWGVSASEVMLLCAFFLREIILEPKGRPIMSSWLKAPCRFWKISPRAA